MGRYKSSKSAKTFTSLGEVVSRMKDGQKDIFYLTGQSLKAVDNSPFVEKLRQRGYEVLFMVDAIDEYCVGQLKEYDGHKLVSISKEHLEITESEDETKRKEELKARFDHLCSTMKEVLGERVEKVVVSDR